MFPNIRISFIIFYFLPIRNICLTLPLISDTILAKSQNIKCSCCSAEGGCCREPASQSSPPPRPPVPQAPPWDPLPPP